MGVDNGFRFGVNMLSTGSRDVWIEKCRRAEALGYDVVGVPDHLGMSAPFPAMMLAAEATERVRVNTFVLNVPFYNPVLLARDVATVDGLSGGRVELGLGAGYVEDEFAAAGIAFPSGGRRVESVREAAATLRRLYADPDYQPQPAQAGGPPLLIAGWGERMLRVAAEHADIIALTGAATAASGVLTLADAAEAADRVAYLRELLGARADSTEVNVLIQALIEPHERDEALQLLAPHLPATGAADLDDFIALLVGTPEQMAERLRERRKTHGINYITVLEHNMDKLAAVIDLVR
ncbi:TIGR03621 family F420-dependent LLM class oxidoreductase [Nocardia sp. NPDC048505]|uniref:TIGR03621 family F420-dependent LLM class oxidoreductase n=1 Tax=Nocardia sp. NPDC048505 TaxID=3155756 RepID=UPI0033DED9F0